MDHEELQRRFDALHQSEAEAAEAEARRLAGIGAAVVVSACLVGIRSRFDGGSKALDLLPGDLEEKVLVPICPEVLAGFPVPRPPSWFVGGGGDAVLDGAARLINEEGRDVTAPFVEGCNRALRLAMLARCEGALLKERSPSCGVREIWVGKGTDLANNPRGLMVKEPGRGVFAALLARRGVPLLETET